MSFSFERMVAGRYLRSKRREGFISVIAGFSFLGILLGVATLIIVMSVMNGFREELVGRILGLNGHINVYSKSGPMFPFEPVIERLKKIDGVTRAVATVEGQVLLSVEGNASGAVVRGLSVEDFNNKPILSTSLIEKLPNIPTFGDDYVSIGKTMAEKFGLHVGDKLVLISPKGRASPFGTVPRSRAFIVGSVFDVGMYEYNSSFIFMSLNMAQLFFDMGEGVSAIEIMTPNLKSFQQTEAAIKNELQGQYSISDWQDSNASFYNALQVERNVMFLILTLIVVVAAFNIISSLIMLVKDKGQDIAILRTMGATRGMIIRIFFYTGATIGTVGTLAGALFGVVFCNNIESIRHVLESLTHTNLFSAEIYFLTKLPAKLDVTEVVLIVGMALFLSFAATIYPAWRAAKLDPVEALRRE